MLNLCFMAVMTRVGFDCKTDGTSRFPLPVAQDSMQIGVRRPAIIGVPAVRRYFSAVLLVFNSKSRGREQERRSREQDRQKYKNPVEPRSLQHCGGVFLFPRCRGPQEQWFLPSWVAGLVVGVNCPLVPLLPRLLLI